MNTLNTPLACFRCKAKISDARRRRFFLHTRVVCCACSEALRSATSDAPVLFPEPLVGVELRGPRVPSPKTLRKFPGKMLRRKIQRSPW